MVKNTIIIGISGVSGAGKSTLAEALQKELGATLIAWDDFDATSTGPDDYVDWYNRGQDYAEWDYPQLELALQKLKSDTKYTLFKEPLINGGQIDFSMILVAKSRIHKLTYS